MSGYENNIKNLFEPMNIYVCAIMEVVPNFQKKKKYKYVVLTVTRYKPYTIEIHIVKIHEGADISYSTICTTKNLKILDYRDSKMQPTYDFQISTNHKVFNFRVTKLESKKEFATQFYRFVGSLQKQWFKDLQLLNFPPNLDLPDLEKHGSLESLLAESEKNPLTNELDETGGRTSPHPTRTNEGYRPLSEREEADIRQFLDELDADSVQCNVSKLTEHLQNQLADVEGTNIHSIMASEPQVLKLMSTLDDAIVQADRMEQQMQEYHDFLSNVEEAMSTLHDRDQLSQIMVDNRGQLLKVLSTLISRFSLDARYVRILEVVNLDKPGNVTQCVNAANYLDELLNVKQHPGEAHLSAVQQQMFELQRLRDTFAAELTKKVNNTVINFIHQLTRLVNVVSNAAVYKSSTNLDTGGGGAGGSNVDLNQLDKFRGVDDLYKTQRADLLQLTALVGGWLQKNRKDVYNDLKRDYIDKMHNFFRLYINELFSRVQQTIGSLLKSTKSTHHRPLESGVDAGSSINLHNVDAVILNQIAKVMYGLLANIVTLVSTEETFIAEFFNISSMSDTQSNFQNPDQLTTLNGCMKNLFDKLESEAFKFIGACEQLQPVLVMPLLVVVLRHAEMNNPSTAATATDKSQTEDTNKQQQQPNKPADTSFIHNFLRRLILSTKRAFNRYIENRIQALRESKPSKKSRCGVLRIVHSYEEFAECSIAVFQQSTRLVDLEHAHGELVRALISQLENVASQSVKTPREVVQLENYHRLSDILRRLKIAGMEEYLQDVKTRYNRSLQEYTKNSMGRPLEKLATFFEEVQSTIDAGVRPEVVQYQFAFSKGELNKVIREYPGREVKRGLVSLRKKVEKHLSEGNNLFQVVWRSIQSEFFEQCQKFNSLIRECYPDSGIHLEFTVDDLQSYFSEISRG